MKSVFPITFFLLLASFSFSQNKNFTSEFGFKSENDAYLAYGQDRYYTNGLFITFRHALKSDRTDSKTVKRIWEAEAGQYMYNAQSGSVPDISYVDRPFAAYLYGGFKMNWFLSNEQVFQVALNGGTIGPDALGEDAQKLLHKVVKFYEVTGWQYQVNNELALNTSIDYTRLLSRTGPHSDFSLKGYANIGTTFSGAGAGILFRAGNINRLFSSVSTNSRISNSATDTVPSRELFFFAQPSLHFIAYDATIQGGMFSDDKGPVTFSPRRMAFSQEVGLKYAAERWTLNFSVIFRSREIKSQVHAHQYGSASVFYRFGRNSHKKKD
ncbi:lipid A deacylase LpxR family protein [Arcticibacter tournemirensis]|uniref:Lipid A deacylase LpxR family protein n=1 Tax=Arcticibacter tournemirensis TaxID=699437 RepID=A0A4Q0MBL8_9SPHI|nr:lipid A deacylase LpxR family protein [Arcticibacter tournemirensis]RXF70697.1 lipid A deacylase LpxR family protein [Arcticibacter tournemirensis]